MQAIHFDHSTNLIGSFFKNNPIPGIGGFYSMQLLLGNEGIPKTNLFSAVKKSMELFNEAGINVRHHFKKIFITNEDATGTYVDWVLTQRALDLILKHCKIIRTNPRIVPN